jgi:DNA-binding transcriptional regulator YiaG
MLIPHVRKPDPNLVSILLATTGTSWVTATTPLVEIGPCLFRPAGRTTAGASLVSEKRVDVAIGELRRFSGLTWEQLARLFSVSRRSLHFWASGKAMTPANEEHLQRLLAVVRKIDRGSASANREALLAVHDDDGLPFDWLIAGEYDRVVSLLGPGAAKRIALPKLSEEAAAARTPRPPDQLVGALQDRVHRETGVARPAKTARARSGR